MKDLQLLVRDNIWRLTPYSSARSEFSDGNAKVFLDANESPYNSPYNRYPDPLQKKVKSVLAKIKDVPEENLFLWQWQRRGHRYGIPRILSARG